MTQAKQKARRPAARRSGEAVPQPKCKSSEHRWRPMRLRHIQNPDCTGMLVCCRNCGDVQLVAVDSIKVFFAILRHRHEPILSAPRNLLVRCAVVRPS